MTILVSVLIPIHNEEALLDSTVSELVDRYQRGQRGQQYTFEIILAENGSTDQTQQIAEKLSQRYSSVRWFSHDTPNYGGALRRAIELAQGEYVVCEEIDICEIEFHRRALRLMKLGFADMVVGSKAMPGARDQRPLLRRGATRVYNKLLRYSVGFTGTDTHGLKAFRRSVVGPIAQACTVEHDVFASELVIRAQRSGVNVLEIPVSIEERRAPSIALLNRVPRVTRNLVQLYRAIHHDKDTGENK